MAVEQRISKEFTFRTPGGIPSKKNKLRKGRQGQGYHYDESVKKMLDGMVLSARGEWNKTQLPALTDVNIGFHYQYSAENSDPDSWSVAVLDCLKQAGVIVDDSAIHLRGFLPVSWERVAKFSETVTVKIFGNVATS